ncbi:DUF1614 domain-containing protein [Methanolobus chelungpuianus]|uniref:DUF1614 domain-containing protein n=1 Tax=Methanolobus chelungpuianus TaxID=502115 RepID=A0AAE3H8M0_9EURY|nr:DUF1614 domain-containing protein [Methanolobus chelungpuianus]MCQ6961683.1 hypothetical protein [Methanolobus chelungpuianus]
MQPLFYSPFKIAFTIVLTLFVAVVVSVLFFGLASTAFARIGFSWRDAFILLFFSLIGSNINIPLRTVEAEISIEEQRHARMFGISYRVPFRETFLRKTTLAINVGGAVIPALVSLYLLSLFPEAFPYVLYATAIVAVITKMVARPVRGVGIVSPALIPPLTAALGSTLVISMTQAAHDLIFITAYVSGTMGTLIGADLLNLRAISKIGAPVASIGGAGTFDGVFLAGVIAVLLV